MSRDRVHVHMHFPYWTPHWTYAYRHASRARVYAHMHFPYGPPVRHVQTAMCHVTAGRRYGDPWGAPSEISRMLGALKRTRSEQLDAPCTDEELRRHEMPLLTALRFRTLVFPPLRSVEALVADAAAECGLAAGAREPPGSEGQTRSTPTAVELRRRAVGHARESLFTDAGLECTPGAIGLACVRLAAEEAPADARVVAWCDERAARAGGHATAGMERAAALVAAHEAARRAAEAVDAARGGAPEDRAAAEAAARAAAEALARVGGGGGGGGDAGMHNRIGVGGGGGGAAAPAVTRAEVKKLKKRLAEATAAWRASGAAAAARAAADAEVLALRVAKRGVKVRRMGGAPA